MNSSNRYRSLADFIGNTPLVRLTRLPGIGNNTLLAKLEGNNPAGSVKDRPAYSMIRRAEERGEIKPGDTLIEATSGNTGIALAMAAAVKGYRMVLIMPEHMSAERRAVMKAFGAEIVQVTKEQGMEGARDLADQMQREGKGRVLDQFANPDNPRAHYEGTGPEIWRDTGGTVTHFVSSMGTTGTIMGTSRYLKEMNPKVQIVMPITVGTISSSFWRMKRSMGRNQRGRRRFPPPSPRLLTRSCRRRRNGASPAAPW